MGDALREALQRAVGSAYRLERELRAGGMSRVFVARDETLDRDVVIKAMPADSALGFSNDRFKREIQVIARLQHPHIVSILTAGAAHGLLYYVMPFVRGETLRTMLRRDGALPMADAVRLLREVLGALAFAHDHGVVHRDVKPENILIEAGHALVADFGIAKAVQDSGNLTSAGVALGTPAYMAPEQATADPSSDHRADLYSVGVLAYELLAGVPPFVGRPQQVVTAHIATPAPSVRDARPDAPDALVDLIARALAKEPDERPQSARAMLDELDAIAATTTGGARIEPTTAIKPAASAAPIIWQTKDTGERPAERVTTAPAPSRRLLWGGLAAALVATIGMITVMALRRNETPVAPAGPPRLIVLPFEHLGAPDDRFITDGLADEVTSRVAAISGLSVVARATAMSYAMPTANLQAVGREAKVTHVVTATVRTDRAADGSRRVRVVPHLIVAATGEELWTDRYDASFVPGELFALQSSIAERVARELGVTVLLPESRQLAARPTTSADAYAAFLQGNLLLARRYEEQSAREAIVAFERAVDADSSFALGWARLAQALVVYQYYYRDKSADRLTRARAAIARAAAIDSTLIELPLARGYLAWWGELDAEVAFRELNTVRRTQPNNAEVRWIIAQIERRRGRIADAVRTMQQAADLDPRSHLVALDLGSTYISMRRYDEAQREIARARTLAPDWAPAVVLDALRAWLASGNPADGRQVIEAAGDRVSMREMVKWMYRYPSMPSAIGGAVRDSVLALSSQADFVDPANVYIAKAYILRARGDTVTARAQFDSARVILEPRVAAAPNDAELHSLLGIAYAGTGREAAARREGERALELVPLEREAVLGATLIDHCIDIAVMSGDVERGVTLMSRILSVPSSFSRALVRREPFYTPLRASPRFAALVSAPETRF